MRVLLVDDDAAIARSIELMLKVEEINVAERTLARRGSTSEKSMTMTLYCST